MSSKPTKQERRLRATNARLRKGLRDIIGPSGKCRKFTGGIGECFRTGFTPTAEYLADRCCVACIAHAALTWRAKR